MTPFDVPPDEMGIDPEIANHELEALLAGDGPERTPDLTRFVDDLRSAFPAATPAAAAHLAGIVREAHLLADKGDPAARPVSNADAPAPQTSRPPKRRRNTMKDRKARILVKIAVPIVALFAVLGIMGSAGALPHGLQHLTSHAAGLVGLDLPTGEDTEGDDGTATDQGDQNESADVKDATDQGDQGDATSTDTSDQGDENHQGDQNDQGNGGTSADTSDQGDQNDQGDTSTGSSDQGDNNDQGTATGSTHGGSKGGTGTSGGSSENDQGSGGSSQDDQGGGSGGSGDNQN